MGGVGGRSAKRGGGRRPAAAATGSPEGATAVSLAHMSVRGRDPTGGLREPSDQSERPRLIPLEWWMDVFEWKPCLV